MRKKLKNWQKILIAYASFFLVFAIAAGSFIMLASSPDKNFGKEDGIILHSGAGEDITDSVLNSNAPVKVLESEKLSVSLLNDGNITVTNRLTGKVWSTAVATDDVNKFGQGYNETHSFLSVTYVNELNAEAEWTAYEQCLKKKQLQIYKLDNEKIRLDFILGESASDQLIPAALTKERFENDILPLLSEDEAVFMKRQYKLYVADELKAEDNPDELYEKYPKLEETPLYIATNMSSKMIKQRLTKVFEKINYTSEDYDKDNRLTGYGSASVTFTYKLAVDLSLSDDELVLEIPKDEIEFYRKHPMLRISLMKFFASSTENAAVMIPSGSGAISEFSVGGSAVAYKGNVYGDDLTLKSQNMPETMDGDSNLSFPIFALRQGKDTLTAVITSGAANATLNYNTTSDAMYCYYDFTVLQSDRAYIDRSSVIQFGNDSISEDISLRYSFGEADVAHSNEKVFSAIACDYRETLQESGQLPKASAALKDNPTVLLELLGNINVKEDFLGLFPINTTLALTNFDKAKEMVEWFGNNTKSNLAVSLKGWNDGGIYRQSPGEVSYSSSLGSKKEREAFMEALKKRNVSSYYSAEHTVFLNTAMFDGYNTSYNAKFVDGSSAVASGYTAVEGGYYGNGDINIISPSRYTSIAEDYIDDGVEAISVSTLTNSLNSDYNLPYFDRSRTMAEVIKALESYKKANVSISCEDANLYALKYCDRIEDMPLGSGKSSALTRSFPFKQIIMHGSIDYTTATNFGVAEAEDNLLMAIATGSGLKATLSYNNSDYSLPSYYSDVYTSSYKNNREKIADYANVISKALEGLGKEKIVSFETVGTLYVTEYSNGTKIYVNIGDTDVNYDTLQIEARAYLRINK